MLSIYFGRWDYDDERYIDYMNGYFDYEYDNSWINNEISKQIIKDIDKSEVIGDSIIKSPILGLITPTELSGGAKMLITMNSCSEDLIYEGTHCGQNCSDWILKISENKDITITRRYYIKFNIDKFKVRILNDNSIVTNNKELNNKYLEFRDNTY